MATAPSQLQIDQYAGIARHRRIHRSARITYCWAADRASPPGKPIPASNRAASHCECARPGGARTAANRQANRDRRRGRSLAGSAPDDCWPVALASADSPKLAGRKSLAAFDFPNGSLVLTEAGSQHRASLQVISGEEGLRALDPGGIDVFASDFSCRFAMRSRPRTGH